MILSLVHTKGGVGKTTSAIYLAAAAADCGDPVRVIDADPQASASSWADRAAHAGHPLPFPVVPMTNPAGLVALRATTGPGELVVIDTPPSAVNDAIIDAAVSAADLVVIPSGLSLAEIDRVFPTLDRTSNSAVTVLLTRVDRRTSAADAMPAALRGEDVPVLPAYVRHRAATAAAFGTVPAQLGDYADVYTEIRGLLGQLATERTS